MFRQSPPQVPMALMFAGIIPFASASGAMFVFRDDLALMNTAALWLLVYAAVILSFIGGVRWGAEIAKRERPRFAELGPSVIGALAGWGFVMAGFRYGMQSWIFAGMAAAIILHYGAETDRRQHDRSDRIPTCHRQAELTFPWIIHARWRALTRIQVGKIHSIHVDNVCRTPARGWPELVFDPRMIGRDDSPG